MLTILAFFLTLGVLITIHEYGHYRVAKACGVKVLRFSIGFGPVVWRRQRGETEFVVSALPLGGYVRMLDEREGPVDPAEQHRAFNRKPLLQRAAVVVAGPLANLLLAVVLYACVNWTGVEEVKPILGTPAPGSLAERAGLRAGQLVRAASQDEEHWAEVRSMTDLRWQILQAALDARVLHLEVSDTQGGQRHRLALDLSTQRTDVETDPLGKLGLPEVYRETLLSKPGAGGPADQAGLRAGDRVLAVDGQPVQDAAAMVRLIRASRDGDRVRSLVMKIQRADETLDVQVTPKLSKVGQQSVAIIDAPVSSAPQMVTIHYGPVEGFVAAARQTWDMSVMTLTMMGRIVVGEASLKNLSGPLTIADYAGRTAQLGLSYYLGFLAVVSIGLGVLNLLPLPMLDGGHLMYYLFEGVTGRPIPEVWLDRLQRGGLAIMLLMMSLALYNDVARILGQT